MFTSPAMIVGLWLVPVVLCILVPLAMLSIWTVIQVSKKMMGENQPDKQTTNNEQGKMFHKKMEHQMAT